mmetsp:Transcript_165555/g.293231  ORF Transcript_165555/g.293231 Transcript_165555/m.293231 type:complete len:93 (-) Transcript_165555:17-295(-)
MRSRVSDIFAGMRQSTGRSLIQQGPLSDNSPEALAHSTLVEEFVGCNQPEAQRIALRLHIEPRRRHGLLPYSPSSTFCQSGELQNLKGLLVL